MTLNLEYELNCDVCKKIADAKSEGLKPRGKKTCTQPWFQMLGKKAHVTTIIKYQKVLDELTFLG